MLLMKWRKAVSRGFGVGVGVVVIMLQGTVQVMVVALLWLSGLLLEDVAFGERVVTVGRLAVDISVAAYLLFCLVDAVPGAFAMSPPRLALGEMCVVRL